MPPRPDGGAATKPGRPVFIQRIVGYTHTGSQLILHNAARMITAPAPQTQRAQYLSLDASTL